MKTISRQRRDELIDALRRGTVPMQSLDLLAVGLDRFLSTLTQELEDIKAGGARFKAVRGEYGTGKTFFARWLAERARQLGFATSEVQISETETPLHRLETVYRRLMERLGTPDTPTGAFRNILDGWFYTLEEDVLAEGNVTASDQSQLLERSNALMEKRLITVSQSAPMFAIGRKYCGMDFWATQRRCHSQTPGGREGRHRSFRGDEFPPGFIDRAAGFRSCRHVPGT
jgi:hypothetical protein